MYVTSAQQCQSTTGTAREGFVNFIYFLFFFFYTKSVLSIME